MIRKAMLFIMILSAAGTAFLGASPQAELPKTEIPVLITSCGQCAGISMIKVLFMKLKFPTDPPSYVTNEFATAEDLKEAQTNGSPYKTVIVVMGASLKGMGAAGVDIDDEIERAASLIEEAHAQGITVIGAHVTGIKNRAQGAAPGDNTDELSIDAVAPASDLLLINAEGNEDRRFTIISDNNTIPMIQVEKTLDLLDKLKELFGQN